MRVRTHRARPTKSLAVRDLKNEPCPQSCWMMKRRTSNPAVGIARRSVSQYLPCVAVAMTTSNAMNGVAVVIS